MHAVARTLTAVWWTAVAAVQWVVSEIRIRVGRGHVPRELVLLRLAMRGPRAAVRLARYDSVPDSRLSTLDTVAATLHDAGRHADAVMVARHADRFARSQRFDSERYPRYLTAAAATWVRIDEPERAERLVRLVTDHEAAGLLGIAAAVANGDLAGARALARGETPDAALVTALLDQGRLDDALSVADELPGHDPRWSDLLDAALQAGREDLVTLVGDRFDVAQPKLLPGLKGSSSMPDHHHLVAAVRVLARAGRRDAAERFARLARARLVGEADDGGAGRYGRYDQYRKAKLKELVQVLAEAGLHDQAVTACGAAADPGIRAELFSVVVHELGAAGRQEQARQLADDAQAQAVAGTTRRFGKAMSTTVMGLSALARSRADIGDDAGAVACLRAAQRSLDRGSATEHLDAYLALARAAHELGRSRLAVAAYLAARLIDRFACRDTSVGLVLAVSPFVLSPVALVVLILSR